VKGAGYFRKGKGGSPPRRRTNPKLGGGKSKITDRKLGGRSVPAEGISFHHIERGRFLNFPRQGAVEKGYSTVYPQSFFCARKGLSAEIWLGGRGKRGGASGNRKWCIRGRAFYWQNEAWRMTRGGRTGAGRRRKRRGKTVGNPDDLLTKVVLVQEKKLFSTHGTVRVAFNSEKVGEVRANRRITDV